MYPDSMIAQSLSDCCLGDDGNKVDGTGDANSADAKGTGISALSAPLVFECYRAGLPGQKNI